MRKISYWAKHNRRTAISSLVAIKLSLAFLASYAGYSLLQLDVHIPFVVFIIALILLSVAAWSYPSAQRTKLSKRNFYVFQKSCDFIVAAGSFVMIGTWVNNNVTLPITASAYASNPVSTINPTAEEILASLQHRDKSTLTRKEKRILKEEFKKQLKVYVVAKLKRDKDGGAKAALIILTIVVALGLLYLVAAIACSLSCNGSDAAAAVVAILGLAAIALGMFFVIRRIVRGPKKKTAEPATEGL
jgi:hypothetical protein